MRTDPTRQISYVGASVRSIDTDLAVALMSTLEENFKRYCAVVNAQLPLRGIDLDATSVKKIYYIDPE